MSEEKKMEELKPCPFCGEAPFQPIYDDVVKRHFVICDECECEGPATVTEAEAIAAWNRRPSPVGRDLGGSGCALGGPASTPSDAQIEQMARAACLIVAGRDPSLPHHDREGKPTGKLNWQAYIGDAKLLLGIAASPSPWRSMESIRREALEECAQVVLREYRRAVGAREAKALLDAHRAIRALPSPPSEGGDK